LYYLTILTAQKANSYQNKSTAQLSRWSVAKLEDPPASGK
jgi:hypothetical protein